MRASPWKALLVPTVPEVFGKKLYLCGYAAWCFKVLYTFAAPRLRNAQSWLGWSRKTGRELS